MITTFALKTERPFVRVCAWCWPSVEEYLSAHPEHAGATLSHTICTTHLEQLRNELVPIVPERGSEVLP